MANNRINRYIGAIVLGTVLTAVPGCTDTWDDHYNSDGLVSGTTATLWDVISDPNSQYSRFADIARQAKYYKDNTHAVSTYTYEDILKSGQVNTVWVPDNSVLTEAEYQKWMQMLASDDIMDGYNVQQQFLGNHIALWRHNISEPGIDTVKMINGKNLVFDKSAKTMADISLGEYNIATTNGVMHVLKGIAPFHYNFYEYLKYSKQPTELGKYVVKQDTTYFSTARSIEGLPDENGNPTYVDSVYFTSNMLFETTRYNGETGGDEWQMLKKGFGARINNEDSVFVMLLPTDNAWNEAKAKLADAYKYASIYEDKVKGDMDNSTTIKGWSVDSIEKLSLEMDLVAPLVFNIHKQPKLGEEMWTLNMFKEKKGEGAEYLLNTFGDTLRAVGDWKPSDLFDVEPIDMSNGIAYEVNSWNFPSQYYTPDVEVEVNAGMFYNIDGKAGRYKVGPGSRSYSFSNSTYKAVTSLYGEVGNNNFYHIDATGPTAAPKVEIKLKGNSASAYVPGADVMSGKYDIQFVMVPHWYLDIATEGMIPDKFFKMQPIEDPDAEEGTDPEYELTDELDTEYIEQLAAQNKYKFKATLSFNNNATKDKTQASKVIEYSGLKVDTLTVLEDFEFPYSYKNMRYTYPTIYVEGQTSKSDAKNGFVFDLVIDKIILKRKN